MKRLKVLLLNLSGIGCHSTTWLHSRIHKASINENVSDFFLYSDFFSRYRHFEACCVDGPHGANTSISKFPDMLSSVITPESFGGI